MQGNKKQKRMSTDKKRVRGTSPYSSIYIPRDKNLFLAQETREQTTSVALARFWTTRALRVPRPYLFNMLQAFCSRGSPQTLVIVAVENEFIASLYACVSQ